MNTIEELYRLLNDDGIDIDTIELAESLWLSQYISKTEIISSSDNDSNTEVNEKHIKKDINSSPTKNESPKNTTRVNQGKKDKRKDAPLHPVSDTDNKSSLPFRTPMVRKLYKDNDLIYAFRHFRQKIVSLKKVKFDEEKVADYMAQTDIFRPFYKKSYEKKFNILFIVDISESMNIWEGLIEDFIKDVKGYHIFKKVLIYYVDTNGDTPKFFKKKEKLSKLNSRWYNYTESNTLVFMFSDMISKSWSSGKLIEEIFLWKKYFPFAIVQMLPQRLWNGTKLLDASIGKMASKKKFIANTKLLSQIEERLRVEGEDISELVKIPLLAFNENAIDAYGRVIRSLPNNKIEGALFEKEDFQGEYEFSVSDNSVKAEDKLRAFYKYASSTSKELLELLATVPLSLPIIKLVQQKLLPSSTQEHLSEIFMSSIFDKEQKIEGFYQFYKASNEDSGVREELIKKIGAKKAFQTIVKISDVIQNQGGTFDFLAYVIDPEQLKNSKNFNEIDREFARISVSVLKEMGGEYRTLAQRLKNGYVFDEYKYGSDKKTVNKPSKSIRVIGVGGGGSNVIDHMVQEGISEIDLIVANTDLQALDSSLAAYKMQLGINATRGLGAGMIPDKGREAALESFDDIKEMLTGADMVVIVAGLGGGTGTGAAPIIAQAAKEIGALTVSIVTSPFKFEGRKRTKLAKEGLEELKRESDSIIVVPNEKLLSIVEKNLGIKESFRMVDDILAQAVGGISKVILSHGDNDINLDFADLKTVMSYSGLSGVGIGYASGMSSAYNAAKSALEFPLFNKISINNAKGVLVHFNIHQDMPVMEVSEAMHLIEESVGRDTSVIFGTTTNSNMDIDETQVTIIATGIEKISEIDIINNVVKQLKNQGWDDKNILSEYKIANKYRADIVLMRDEKPLTVIEVKSSLNNENMDRAINQVVSYATELNLSVTYITDGKKIYEYDIERKIYKEIDTFPSADDIFNRKSIFDHIIPNDINRYQLELASKLRKKLVKYKFKSSFLSKEISPIIAIPYEPYNIKEKIINSNTANNSYTCMYTFNFNARIDLRKKNPKYNPRPWDAKKPYDKFGKSWDENKYLSVREKQVTMYAIAYITVQLNSKNKFLSLVVNKFENVDILQDVGRSRGVIEDNEKNNFETVQNKKVFEIEEWLLKRYKNPNAFPITLGDSELYTLKDILFEHFEDEKKDIINEAIAYIKEKYGDIKWELKEQLLFDKVNQRNDKLEQLINLLIPYSELEYTSEYDREDYSNPDEYPEPIYLISKDFDQNYLDDIIKDMQEDVYELYYVTKGKDFENKDYIKSLLEKKYRITYEHINEPLGIDFDCNVYEEYTEEYNNCIIYIDASESIDLEEAWEIANTDADMIEEWFYENYEDPANSLPYISKEGGYIPIHGSLITAEEAILSEFEGHVSDGAIKEAIDRIENEYGFMEWSPIPQNQEELDSTLANETSKDFDTHEEKTENIEQYTVCQMLGTSYFIKIILSEKDKKKMSSGYVYIDIRDYGIDAYLRYPNKKSATSYDMERFQNILNNAEKKNWEIELNCNNAELQESLGETYLTSEIFKPFNTEKEKEDYLNFLAIESEMEAWLSENYIEMEDELTYDAYEGKYKHIRGGTSDLEETLYSKFENIYPQGYVDKAIKTINQGYGDRDFTQVIYSEEDDTVPDISYFTKKYSHKIDEIVKWVFENYEDPISLTSDVLKEILVVEFQEKYSNDFIEEIIESIKLGYGNELLRNIINGGGEGN